MTVPPGLGAIPAPFAAFLTALLAQRLYELWLSQRNTRRLVARGAVEHGQAHYPWIVAIHILYFVALILEVVGLGVRPTPMWPVWLALWLLAQALRLATMRTLGGRWTTRVWVVPGEPLETGGPYRLFRHPNYLAVLVELPAGALLFGAWRTALGISVLNSIALAVRVRVENAALRGASR